MSNSSPKDENRDRKIKKWTEEIEPFLHKLLDTWDERRLYDTTKDLYLQQAKKHVEDLMNEMIVESEDKNQSLYANIKYLMDTLRKLSKELDKKISVNGYEELPLDVVQEKLTEQVEDLKLYKEELQRKLKQLQQREHEVCRKLGAKPIVIDKKVPNEKDLESLSMYINAQEKEMNRLEKSFFNMREHIIDMMSNLQIKVENEFQQCVCEEPDCFCYTEDNMKMLKDWQHRLKTHLEQIEQRVQEKRDEMKALWVYLEEPDQYCQEFLKKYSDSTASTYRAIEKEIERCKEKRTQNIAKYVEKIRMEIESLWDLCKYSQKQRNNFVPLHSQTYTDSLLNLHEMEAARLRKFYQDNKKVFELINEYEVLIERMKVLDRRAMDPDRLNNRGGQLLAEEKERKIANKKLPKIVDQLTALVQEYENIHGETLTFDGLSFNEYYAKIWEDYEKEKENIKTEKQAKDKSAKKTPLSVSKKTPNTYSIRQIDHSKSVKRKLLDESASNTIATKIHASGDKSRRKRSANYVIKRGKFGSRKSLNHSGKSGKKMNKNQDKSQVPDSLSSSYEQFQEHLEKRDDLRSSCLPSNVLQSGISKMKTPVKTPAKPLRKILRDADTPSRSFKMSRTANTSSKKMPNAGTPLRSSSRSPKSRTHLTVAPSNMPLFL